MEKCSTIVWTAGDAVHTIPNGVDQTG